MWQSLYDSFLTSITDATTSIAGLMSGELKAPLTVAMTLYITLYGFAVLKGAIQEPVLDFALRALKLAIIWSLVVTAGNYTTWVSSTIQTGIPEFVSNITGGDGTLPSDSVMIKAQTLSVKVQEEYSSGLSARITGYVLSIVVMGYSVIFAGIAFAIILLTTFGLSLMAAIGPLFICFALFDATRGWFFSWLGQTVNFGILQLLVTVLMQILISFIAKLYERVEAVEAMQAAMNYIGALSCGFVFFFLLPSIASALSGGAQSSTGLLQRAVERSFGKNPPSRNRGGNSGGSATKK